jgi:hypothetical protein
VAGQHVQYFEVYIQPGGAHAGGAAGCPMNSEDDFVSSDFTVDLSIDPSAAGKLPFSLACIGNFNSHFLYRFLLFTSLCRLLQPRCGYLPVPADGATLAGSTRPRTGLPLYCYSCSYICSYICSYSCSCSYSYELWY